jgi:hypothetical protein
LGNHPFLGTFLHQINNIAVYAALGTTLRFLRQRLFFNLSLPPVLMPVRMTKLASFLLAIAQLTASVHGLPAGEANLHTDAMAARAITLPTDVPVTTSYSTAIESLQSASTTSLPLLSGVRQIAHVRLV